MRNKTPHISDVFLSIFVSCRGINVRASSVHASTWMHCVEASQHSELVDRFHQPNDAQCRRGLLWPRFPDHSGCAVNGTAPPPGFSGLPQDRIQLGFYPPSPQGGLIWSAEHTAGDKHVSSTGPSPAILVRQG